MTACTCPATTTDRRGAMVHTIRHTDGCPARPAWCAGGPGRPPHVVDGVRPRKPDAIPLCDPCETARRRKAER